MWILFRTERQSGGPVLAVWILGSYNLDSLRMARNQLLYIFYETHYYNVDKTLQTQQQIWCLQNDSTLRRIQKIKTSNEMWKK